MLRSFTLASTRLPLSLGVGWITMGLSIVSGCGGRTSADDLGATRGAAFNDGPEANIDPDEPRSTQEPTPDDGTVSGKTPIANDRSEPETPVDAQGEQDIVPIPIAPQNESGGSTTGSGATGAGSPPAEVSEQTTLGGTDVISSDDVAELDRVPVANADGAATSQAGTGDEMANTGAGSSATLDMPPDPAGTTSSSGPVATPMDVPSTPGATGATGPAMQVDPQPNGSPDIVGIQVFNAGDAPVYIDWSRPHVTLEYEVDGETITAWQQASPVLRCDQLDQGRSCCEGNGRPLTAFVLLPGHQVTSTWFDEVFVPNDDACAPCQCADPIAAPTGPMLVTVCTYPEITCPDDPDACAQAEHTGPYSDLIVAGEETCFTVEATAPGALVEVR